jgi:hypothetical protein
MGQEKYREIMLDRMKKMGILPENTDLPPINPLGAEINNTLIVAVSDSGAGMSDEYEPPFRFTGGVINAVTINVSGEPYSDLGKEARAMFSRQ